MSRKKKLLRMSPFCSELIAFFLFSPKLRNHIAPPDASRCVLLKNCFDPADETGTAWVKELEDDVKRECEDKYGKVCIPSVYSNLIF
jgi:hypothetical protein